MRKLLVHDVGVLVAFFKMEKNFRDRAGDVETKGLLSLDSADVGI